MAEIAILVEKVYEDLELQYPRRRLKEAGHTVDVIGPNAGETYVGKVRGQIYPPLECVRGFHLLFPRDAPLPLAKRRSQPAGYNH